MIAGGGDAAINRSRQEPPQPQAPLEPYAVNEASAAADES
jgi:hypothetical protein